MHLTDMAYQGRELILLKGIKNAVRSSLGCVYMCIHVDPRNYLQRIRRTCGLPIQSFQEMFSVPQETSRPSPRP